MTVQCFNIDNPIVTKYKSTKSNGQDISQTYCNLTPLVLDQ